MDPTRIHIDRPVYTQSALDGACKRRYPEAPPISQRIKNHLSPGGGCTTSRCVNGLMGLFPFTKHIKNYKWRDHLAGDIISGLTVGIMHIPMGLGFSMLSGLPPVYGLYTSFYSVALYFLLGQSPHLSFGTMAVVSIMLSEATSTHGILQPSAANSNQVPGNTSQSNDSSMYVPGSIISDQTITLYEMLNSSVEGKTPSPLAHSLDQSIPKSPGVAPSSTVPTAMAITMLSGIILIVMALLRLGQIVAFIPMSVVSGFTTGSAFHIATSQLKSLFGIQVPKHTGNLKLIKTWKDVAMEITKTNLCDMTISLCCLTFLFIVKEIINPRLRHKLPVPIPGEIIVVTVVTLISYFASLNGNYGIAIINEIQVGFIAPEVPPVNQLGAHLVDAFLIALIVFVVSFSMISTFARKHKYDVNMSQEMMAYGLSNLFGSFFGSFAAAAAPPRCLVLESTGARTMMAHLVTLAVPLLSILVIGRLFEPLPSSCLSSIIVCSLIPLFKQFQHPVQFWPINRYDSAIWVVTMLSVTLLDIDIGLAVGVGFAIITISLQSCLASGTVLAATGGHPDLQQPAEMHELSRECSGIKVFRFESNLHFASQSRFKQQLFKHTVDPQKLPSQKNTAADSNPLPVQNNCENVNNNKQQQQQPSPEPEVDSSKTTTEAITAKNLNFVKTGISDVYTISPENYPDSSGVITENLCSDLHTIILDASSISYIDVMGINVLKQLRADYQHVGIRLVLAHCGGALLSRLETAAIASSVNTAGTGNKINNDATQIDIFPTILDAIATVTISGKPKQSCNGLVTSDCDVKINTSSVSNTDTTANKPTSNDISTTINLDLPTDDVEV